MALAGVDQEHVAFVDEERHLNVQAGFDFRVLGRALRRVAFDARLGFDNLQLDAVRQVDPEDLALVAHDVDVHVFFEEVQFPLDLFFFQVDLIERFGIHERMLFTAGVQVLHLTVFDVSAAHVLTRTERTLNGVAVAQVFQLGADEGSAFTRFNVLEIDNGEQVAVYFNGQACFKIVN